MAIELRSGYSTISSKELMEKVIPDYCVEKPLNCVFWERGVNDVYQLRCANRRYSLRVYRHGIHSRDEVDFEVDALNHLHNNGVAVAYPIARKSGGYITEIMASEGIRYVLITAFAEGSVPDYDSLDAFRLTGKSLAELHNGSDTFETPHKRDIIDMDLFINDRFKSIEPHIMHRPDDLAQLQLYLENACSAVQRVGSDNMDFGFCHGDVHGGNAHLHEGVLTHFDFEECGFGYRVFDLATFKWSTVLQDAAPDKWLTFVEGYESVRKIKTADLELLDTFVVLRHIWLIAFHMRNADDFGGELLDDKYIDRQWKRLNYFSTEGIGAALETKNENVVVVKVLEGGPAANSGLIQAEDRIVAVAEGDDGDMVDTPGLPLDEVVNLVRGPIGTTVRLKVLPAGATDESATNMVALVRDAIVPPQTSS